MSAGLASLEGLPLIMDAGDLAKVVGCSRTHAYRLIGAGDFDAAVVMVGGRKRISRALLEQWLAGQVAA